MREPYIIPLSSPDASLETVGGKGMSLTKLANTGLPVPDGFHVTTAAYKNFVDANKLLSSIQEALRSVDPNRRETVDAASAQIRALFDAGSVPEGVTTAVEKAYTALSAGYDSGQGAQSISVAVRSSATAEDLLDASFAGQQETFLNVRGTGAVLAAIKRCWSSLWTARAISYRMQQNIDHSAVSMAVVVQVLVLAEVAGIMFTANPLNGQRDQTVINASWGLGEAVVGGVVTPDTFTVRKDNHLIITREISDKQFMTLCKNDGTEVVPVSAVQRTALSLEDAQIVELAKLGNQIEALYGVPMDIEWAIGNRVVFILQARPITALPQATADSEISPPAEWVVPDPKAIYLRSSIVELLPGPLTPLFGTLGLQAVNAGSMRLFSQVWGPDTVHDDMVVTVNSYAYFQMRLNLKFWWGLLTNVWSFIPQFFRGEERWLNEARPQYMAVIERCQKRPLDTYTAVQLLEGVTQIAAEAVNIYNIYQSGVIGLAMVSEMLFTPFYEKLIRRKGDPPALTFILGGDSMPIRAEKSLYTVAQWCREHQDLTAYIERTPSAQLAKQLTADQPPLDVDSDAWRAWQQRFLAHLDQFGHAVYDMDFYNPVPADNPQRLIETVKIYLHEEGANPYERQQKMLDQREKAAQEIINRLKGLRLKWFQKLLGWAQKYVPMREDTLSDIGLGYPLLRQMLRELGRRLVQAGVLESVDDVFWLSETEAGEAARFLDGVIEMGDTLHSAPEKVRNQQAVWQAAKRITPPVGLPERTGLMKLLERFAPVQATLEGNIIKGVATSPGKITVAASVLHGPEDFEKMLPGTALVAAITTPAWTPLFAIASAIVTDVGGPLSHGSIVAREYGIPAVMATGVATKRIRNGQMITVDGDAGTVTLIEGTDIGAGR
jgi:phosphohistidine swiveling domain-containing protein